ncbi:MAG: hypothetical protein QXK90_01180 [Candidatus Parvarchaeota archaeon]
MARRKPLVGENFFRYWAEKLGVKDVGALIDELDPRLSLAENWKKFKEALARRGITFGDVEYSEAEEQMLMLKQIEDAARETGLLDRLYEEISELSNRLIDRELEIERYKREREELEMKLKEALITKEEYERKLAELKKYEDELKKWASELTRLQFSFPVLSEAELKAKLTEVGKAKPTPPPAPRELSEKEVEELRKLWELQIRRALGRFPRDAALHFDVELLPIIKTMPFEKAKEVVIREAGVYTPPAPPEVVAFVPVPPPPEVKARPYAPEVMPYIPMPPKVEVPKAPLSPLKFPRRVSSEEIKVLWDAFDYRMRSMGLYPWDYKEYFEKYIANAWFSKWDDVVRSFEMMIKDISEGKPPAIKPAPLPWKEPRDAVLHLLWLGKVKDMDELLMALNVSGIFLDAETVKAIIREEMAKPREKQDIWFRQTPKEYLEVFLKD